MLYYLRWSLSIGHGSPSIDGCKIEYSVFSESLEAIKGSLKGPPPVLNRSHFHILIENLKHLLAIKK